MQQNKVGKGMLIVAWIIGLGLMTLVFDDQLAKQLNPNSDPITSSIMLIRPSHVCVAVERDTELNFLFQNHHIERACVR